MFSGRELRVTCCRCVCIPENAAVRHGSKPGLEIVQMVSDSRPPTRAKKAPTQPGASWTFLTNHAHVLVVLSRDPTTRLRDVANSVGITERAVQGIISDLEAAGVVVRERDGRRNRYRLCLNQPLRHPLESAHTISQLIRSVK